jgi:hypothetical protein
VRHIIRVIIMRCCLRLALPLFQHAVVPVTVGRGRASIQYQGGIILEDSKMVKVRRALCSTVTRSRSLSPLYPLAESPEGGHPQASSQAAAWRLSA